MRRIPLIFTLALASIASAIFVPGAGAGNFDPDKMGCAGESPSICPTATAGQPYSLTIYLKPPDGGRGEDFACAKFRVDSGSFPPGLSISDEGIISGTPTAAGGYDFYLKVTYDKQPTCDFKLASEDRFIINVNPAVQRLVVNTAPLPDGNVNRPYTAGPLTVTGGTVSSWTLAAGALPPGLTLSSNGTIAGTPTQGGLFQFTVQANGSPNNDTGGLSIFIVAPLELQLPNGRPLPATGLTAKKAVNEALTTSVKAVGGRPPYVFSATALPPGLNLDAATGTISGTGTVAGRYTSTIAVKDQAGATKAVEFKFTILPLLQFIKGKGLPAGKVNRQYSARVAVSGKDARTAQFAVSGQIPPGLELDDLGRLTGVLLRAGTYRMRVFVFPLSGSPISQVFTIRVRA